MNTVRRRTRPNSRHRVKFYSPSVTAGTDGELINTFTFVAAGYFAMEKPLKPREIVEGGRNINEQETLLIGQWTKLLNDVTHGMVCFIPSKQKVYAVNGNATDPWGDRMKVHIYIVDNVSKTISSDLIPGK